MDDVVILNEPQPSEAFESPVYQVTLENGAVMTRASSFAGFSPTPPPIFSEHGRLLAPS